MRIDRHSTQPLYVQLKEILLKRIQKKEYQPGQQIPSELDLCRELSLSRPTVRQAVAELVSEGILYIEKGRGTFVASEPEHIELEDINWSRFSLLAARSLKQMSDIKVTTKSADASLDQLFNLKKRAGHAGYWSVQWQLSFDGQNYAVCESLIPIYMFPELGPDLEMDKKLLDILANKYAYLPQRGSARLVMRQARLDEAKALDISRSAPIIEFSTKMTARSGDISEISTAILRADLVALNFSGQRS